MDLRDRLKTEMQSWSPQLRGNVRNNTPLISSGILDSTALFSLLLWIEDQTGCPIDPMSLEVVDEWDTINDIAAFVERKRNETQP